jgi:hypothetical protein
VLGLVLPNQFRCQRTNGISMSKRLSPRAWKPADLTKLDKFRSALSPGRCPDIKLGIQPDTVNDLRIGGAERDRTVDPLLAKQVLSQLSYSPIANH